MKIKILTLLLPTLLITGCTTQSNNNQDTTLDITQTEQLTTQPDQTTSQSSTTIQQETSTTNTTTTQLSKDEKEIQTVLESLPTPKDWQLDEKTQQGNKGKITYHTDNDDAAKYAVYNLEEFINGIFGLENAHVEDAYGSDNIEGCTEEAGVSCYSFFIRPETDQRQLLYGSFTIVQGGIDRQGEDIIGGTAEFDISTEPLLNY